MSEQQQRVHIVFDAPGGLRYDTAIHDFIDEEGNLAPAERVATVWNMRVEDVEDDRQARGERSKSDG